MPRKQKKYYYIYKTTNVKNKKFYIGMHSTDNLDDGYMGSGKRLWSSINYHGKENHICEILEYCENRKELIKREKEIVNEELLNEDLCMNLRIGGSGGFMDDEHMMKCQRAGGNGFKNKLLMNEEFSKYISNIRSLKAKKHHKDGLFKRVDWTGKKHSEETKDKMKKSKNKGKLNSQFGTCWITNEVENRKIKRGDVIPEGFRLGRVIKK